MGRNIVCFQKDGSLTEGLLVLFSEKSAFDDAEQEKTGTGVPNGSACVKTSRRICSDRILTFEGSQPVGHLGVLCGETSLIPRVSSSLAGFF